MNTIRLSSLCVLLVACSTQSPPSQSAADHAGSGAEPVTGAVTGTRTGGGMESIPDSIVTVTFTNLTDSPCTVTDYSLAWSMGGTANATALAVLVPPHATATAEKTLRGSATIGLSASSTTVRVTARCQ